MQLSSCFYYVFLKYYPLYFFMFFFFIVFAFITSGTWYYLFPVRYSGIIFYIAKVTMYFLGQSPGLLPVKHVHQSRVISYTHIGQFSKNCLNSIIPSFHSDIFFRAFVFDKTRKRCLWFPFNSMSSGVKKAFGHEFDLYENKGN